MVFSVRVAREQINREVGSVAKELEDQLNKNLQEFKGETRQKIEERLGTLNTKVSGLEGDVCRTMALISRDKGDLPGSTIWWLRAAVNYHDYGDVNMVRLALGGAKRVLDAVAYGSRIDEKQVGEYQERLKKIPDGQYRIERERLDKAFKEALDREQQPPPQPTGSS